MTRIDLADADDLDPDQRDLIETLSTAEGLPEEYRHLLEDPERNVYRAIARRPSILEPFRTFGRRIWADCGLSARERELAILAVGREFDAEYEWHQHVRIALREGIEPDEIRALSARNDDPFSDEERALLGYVRAYVNHEVDDETFEDFVDAYDEPTAVGVGLLVGVYVTISMFGDALQLETEEPFVGWDLESL
jgi:4-carboxymuconolactone decarboxylase